MRAVHEDWSDIALLHTHARTHHPATVILRLSALGHLLQHHVVGNLAEVRRLDFAGDTDKLLAQRVLGRGVQHLLLDLGGVRGPVDSRSEFRKFAFFNTHKLQYAPGNEANLVSLALARLLVLEVEHGVAAVRFRQRCDELLVVALLHQVLDDDGRVVVGELVDDVLVLFAQLQLLERLHALVIDADSAGLHS